MTTTPDLPTAVSVLIVSHNDGHWLMRCLASIRAQTIASRVEVILADNASDDGTDRVARELIQGWPAARFITTGGDFGFCAGTNCAARQASGKYLFVLNPDTWLEPDCIEQLWRAADREDATACGATILNYDDDSLQSECPDGYDFCGNLMLPRGNKPARQPFSAGGFFFISREAFFRIGGLDERFFMYCEEQDLAWRIWISGGKVVAVPAARVHHRGAVGVNPEGGAKPAEHRTSTRKRFLANRNRMLVLVKNCQHLLLAMLPACALLVLLEGAVTLVATRKWHLAKSGCFDALLDLFRLRSHVRDERKRIATFRTKGDFFLLRFFRLGFGRSSEVTKVLQSGFPKFR